MSLPGSLQKCSRASMRPWALPAEARPAMSNPLESWTEEQRSAYLYRVCADAEAGTARADLFTRLAGEAEAQAAIWRDRKSTRLNSRHSQNSHSAFCFKNKKHIA